MSLDPLHFDSEFWSHENIKKEDPRLLAKELCIAIKERYDAFYEYLGTAEEDKVLYTHYSSIVDIAGGDFTGPFFTPLNIDFSSKNDQGASNASQYAYGLLSGGADTQGSNIFGQTTKFTDGKYYENWTNVSNAAGQSIFAYIYAVAGALAFEFFRYSDLDENTRSWCTQGSKPSKAISGDQHVDYVNETIEVFSNNAWVNEPLARADNLTATTSPTATDDIEAGYTAGSVWLNVEPTSLEVWRCFCPRKGAARWIQQHSGFYVTNTTPPADPFRFHNFKTDNEHKGWLYGHFDGVDSVDIYEAKHPKTFDTTWTLKETIEIKPQPDLTYTQAAFDALGVNAPKVGDYWLSGTATATAAARPYRVRSITSDGVTVTVDRVGKVFNRSAVYTEAPESFKDSPAPKRGFLWINGSTISVLVDDTTSALLWEDLNNAPIKRIFVTQLEIWETSDFGLYTYNGHFDAAYNALDDAGKLAHLKSINWGWKSNLYIEGNVTYKNGRTEAHHGISDSLNPYRNAGNYGRDSFELPEMGGHTQYIQTNDGLVSLDEHFGNYDHSVFIFMTIKMFSSMIHYKVESNRESRTYYLKEANYDFSGFTSDDAHGGVNENDFINTPMTADSVSTITFQTRDIEAPNLTILDNIELDNLGSISANAKRDKYSETVVDAFPVPYKVLSRASTFYELAQVGVIKYVFDVEFKGDTLINTVYVLGRMPSSESSFSNGATVKFTGYEENNIFVEGIHGAGPEISADGSTVQPSPSNSSFINLTLKVLDSGGSPTTIYQSTSITLPAGQLTGSKVTAVADNGETSDLTVNLTAIVYPIEWQNYQPIEGIQNPADEAKFPTIWHSPNTKARKEAFEEMTDTGTMTDNNSNGGSLRILMTDLIAANVDADISYESLVDEIRAAGKGWEYRTDTIHYYVLENSFTHKTKSESTIPIISGNTEQTISENTTDTNITVRHESPNPVTFAMATSDDSALFSVNASGEVTFDTAPDYDSPADIGANNEYIFTVEVTDTVTSETAVQSYTVTVTSQTPSFSGPFTKTVPENTKPPLALSVYPFDTLSLEGADSALFELAGSSLRFITAPDFEAPADAGADNEYNVTVKATKGTKVTTQAYVFTVTDVADILPTFASPFAATVSENQTSAITADVTYFDTLVLEGADAALFTLVGQVVTFTNAPDFEDPQDVGANNVYNFDIRGANALGEVVQSYTITVSNVVEAVTFTGPFAYDAEEDQTAAFAADVAGDLPITFALSGVDAALFGIDTAGVVTFNSAPDLEAPADVGADNVHNITVEATNSQGMVSQAYTVTVVTSALDEIGVEIAGDDHMVGTWSWSDAAVTKDFLGATWTNGESKIIHDEVYTSDPDYFQRGGYSATDQLYWISSFSSVFVGLSGPDGASYEYATPAGDTAVITWGTNTFTAVKTASIT